MAKDWIGTPDYDRWRTDPEYRTLGEREIDQTIEGYKALDEWHTRSVVTDFRGMVYKVGQNVKWLGEKGERLQGYVIGATEVPAFPTNTYVILLGEKVVEVDEVVLMHEWKPPEEVEQKPADPPPPAPYDEDDIPF